MTIIRRRTRTTSSVSIALAVAVSALVSIAPAAAQPEVVKSRPRVGEYQPIRGDAHMAWQHNTRKRPGHYDVFTQPIDGGAIFKVNTGKSNGANGDIEGDVLVYQQYNRRRSDLKLIDLISGQRGSPPEGVNTRHWEYWPSMSGDLLLFGRLYGNGTRRIFMVDMSTGNTTRLDRVRGSRAELDPGQINGDYAVWDRCPSPTSCDVLRYRISTGETEVVTNGNTRQHASSVAPDGTIYYARSRGCGNRARLVRHPPQGPEEILVRLPNGRDVGTTHVYVDPEGGVTLLYDNYDCDRASESDAWQIVEGKPPQLSVTVDGDGDGRVTSSPAGIDCGADCSETYERGTGVTLTATPQGDSAFAGWGGACSGNQTTCTVTMDRSRSVTATFTTKPLLTVNKAGSGTGTVTSSPGGINCGSDCAEPYSAGSNVTLTASAASGSVFTGWSGACGGTSTSCQVNMNVSKSVTATFDLLPPNTLQVSVSGSGSVSGTGIDCPGDCTEDFAPGTQVSLTANYDPLLTLTWGDDCTGELSDTCMITMDSDKNVSATFVP